MDKGEAPGLALDPFTANSASLDRNSVQRNDELDTLNALLAEPRVVGNEEVGLRRSCASELNRIRCSQGSVHAQRSVDFRGLHVEGNELTQRLHLFFVHPADFSLAIFQWLHQ